MQRFDLLFECADVLLSPLGFFEKTLVGFAALSIEFFGVGSFFVLITITQVMIGGFALFRMTRRAAVPNEAQGTFVAIPESSSALAVSLNPEAEWIAATDEFGEDDDPFRDNPYVT